MKRAQPQLKSLSIFFPFLNDAQTVQPAIRLAFNVGNKVTKNLEVIALHGGNSKDDTWKQIQLVKKQFPSLKVINRQHNTEGYAVIKHGFSAATKEWIFYTDGDLQYDVRELTKLVRAQHTTQADVVNGYKISRGDSLLRTLLGKAWQLTAIILLKIPIRDVDCDFRLIRRSVLKKISLRSSGAIILEELLIKLTRQGASFAEVPVSHRPRLYGKSNYSPPTLILEKLRVLRNLV